MGLGLRDNDNQSTPPRCVQDIDQLEYTVVDGEIVYVAILEITRRDKHPTIKNPPKSYFESILARYDKDLTDVLFKQQRFWAAKLSALFSMKI